MPLSASNQDTRRIMRTYKRVAQVLRVLTLRDEDGQEQTIRVTEEHPFHVDSQGWTAARKLGQGDILLAVEGTLAVVSNEREAHPQGVTVYNLEVEQAHTYFVLAENATDAAAAVWVHNATNYQQYQDEVADLYGGPQLIAARRFRKVNGRPGEADRVASVGGQRIAVESKHVNDWARSLRNPSSPIGAASFARAERRKMVSQVRDYLEVFDEVHYHSNSAELLSHYGRVFQKMGLDTSRIKYFYTR